VGLPGRVWGLGLLTMVKAPSPGKRSSELTDIDPPAVPIVWLNENPPHAYELRMASVEAHTYCWQSAFTSMSAQLLHVTVTFGVHDATDASTGTLHWTDTVSVLRTSRRVCTTSVPSSCAPRKQDTQHQLCWRSTSLPGSLEHPGIAAGAQFDPPSCERCVLGPGFVCRDPSTQHLSRS